MNLNYKLGLALVLLLTYQSDALEIAKGNVVGCFKRTQHDTRINLKYTQNCFDFCESQFYR